ncbi:hypothetical protein ACOMHN_053063 [Nucella lapillus]
MKRRSCICGDISTKPVDFWNAVNSNLCELVPRFDTSKVKVEPSTVSVEVNSDWTDSDLKSEPVTTDAGKTEVVTTDNSSDVIKTEPITADINSDVIKTEPFTADINSDVIKTEPITADINSDVIRTEAVTTNTSAPESTASRQESMDTCKHGGYKTLLRTLQLDYAGVPREVAMKFVGLCSVCQNDTAQRTRAAKATEALRERVAKVPCTTQAFNVRCQVDVMSMGQNIDGRYSHIGLYLDHWTHFLTLFPMSGCAAQHVAYGLASSVLPYFGPPRFLHSPEGKEFATQVIEHSMDTWKGAEKMTMPQGKAGLENLGQAMEEMQARLTQEIKDRAKEDSLQLPLPWASWLGKIMFDINNKRDETTGRSPYSRVFERSIGMSEAGEPTEPIRDVAYKVAYSQIDWHDFVVVETVDFQQNETGTLPPPTTPEEVEARILNQERYERGEIAIDDAVEMEVESDEEEAEEEEEEEEDSEEEEGPIVPPLPPPPKPAQPPEEKEPQDMEEDSDEEDRPPLPPPPPRPKVAPPPAPPPPPPPPPTEAPPLPPTPDQVVIRRDYNPKDPLQPQQFFTQQAPIILQPDTGSMHILLADEADAVILIAATEELANTQTVEDRRTPLTTQPSGQVGSRHTLTVAAPEQMGGPQTLTATFVHPSGQVVNQQVLTADPSGQVGKGQTLTATFVSPSGQGDQQNLTATYVSPEAQVANQQQTVTATYVNPPGNQQILTATYVNSLGQVANQQNLTTAYVNPSGQVQVGNQKNLTATYISPLGPVGNQQILTTTYVNPSGQVQVGSPQNLTATYLNPTQQVGSPQNLITAYVNSSGQVQVGNQQNLTATYLNPTHQQVGSPQNLTATYINHTQQAGVQQTLTTPYVNLSGQVGVQQNVTTPYIDLTGQAGVQQSFTTAYVDPSSGQVQNFIINVQPSVR